MASLDLSGRSFLVFDASFDNPILGNFDTGGRRNFQALALNVQMISTSDSPFGKNNHHKSESLFRGNGTCLA